MSTGQHTRNIDERFIQEVAPPGRERDRLRRYELETKTSRGSTAEVMGDVDEANRRIVHQAAGVFAASNTAVGLFLVVVCLLDVARASPYFQGEATPLVSAIGAAIVHIGIPSLVSWALARRSTLGLWLYFRCVTLELFTGFAFFELVHVIDHPWPEPAIVLAVVLVGVGLVGVRGWFSWKLQRPEVRARFS